MFAFHMAFPKILPVKPKVPVVSDVDMEKYCLALAIYHEARGEPLPGQFAVAITILNRVRSSAYPEECKGLQAQHADGGIRTENARQARAVSGRGFALCDAERDDPLSSP